MGIGELKCTARVPRSRVAIESIAEVALSIVLLACHASPRTLSRRVAEPSVQHLPMSGRAVPANPAESEAPAACNVEAVTAADALPFAWERLAARGIAGWVADLSADEGGVFAAGADSSRQTGARSFVASYARDGRERFRVSLDQTAISGLKPPRASAVSLAAAGNGAVYALSVAASPPAGTALHLTLLDASGRERFSVPLELSAQVPARVVADSRGDAFVIGLALSGELTVAKYSSDGARAWLNRYPYEGELPWLAIVGDHLALAASLHGFAELGAERTTRLGSFHYRCEDTARECEADARALFVAELDGDGKAVKRALFGSASNAVSASGFAALPDGRLIVTGEFYGPPLVMGNRTLCELQPGMPARESGLFREAGSGDAHACDCRTDQRDLFVLELSRDGVPLWIKTLALGEPKPRVAAGADGGIIWAAQVTSASPPLGAPATSSALHVWQLDASGFVRRRQSASRAFKLLSVAANGAVYVSDGRNLQRAFADIVKQ